MKKIATPAVKIAHAQPETPLQGVAHLPEAKNLVLAQKLRT